MNRFALGTAQFGMRYGINNSSKAGIDINEIEEILKFSSEKKIDLLDTAMNYGDSEKKLGRCDLDKFKIVTKLSSLEGRSKNLESLLKNKINESLKNLNRSNLHALLLHNPEDLLGPNGDRIFNYLNNFKNEGVISKIGLSIYSPSILDKLIPRYEFDLVQAPFNILDTRLLDSGWLEKLNAIGIEIHARSIFLQGLLLIPSQEIPNEFKRWESIFIKIEKWSKEKKMSLIEACILFTLKQKKIDKIILGIDSLKHLKEILKIDFKKNILGLPKISSIDESLINPSKWKAN
tara:strand:- start:1298 stop:2170 length:873 start_codon:yes stop_codon:yes gene_type:complete